MALFQRIFNSKKQKNEKKIPTVPPQLDENSSWKSPNFKKDQVRLLVFRAIDYRERKLLFDSKAVKKLEANQAASCKPKTCGNGCKKLDKSGEFSSSHCSQGDKKYELLKPSSDVKMLGEMMFGSVAMSYKGTTLKVHTMRSPAQLMLTKVFSCSKLYSAGITGDVEDSCSLQNSTSEIIASKPSQHNANVAHSFPVDVPDHMNRHIVCDEDSGIAVSGASTGSLGSLFPSPSSGSGFSLTPDNYNSLHRRWLRNQATSMEYGIRRKSEEFNSSTEEPGLSSGHGRIRIGMAVIFTLDEDNEENNKHFQNFFFSHITLIEGYLNKLRNVVERACSNKRIFIHTLVDGFESIQNGIYDLYTSPRLSEPVWLTMMSSSCNHRLFCHKLMTQFIDLTKQYDTKDTNFFWSTLLTAVLTHHLAWVPTVTPGGAAPNKIYQDKHTAKWLDMLAKSHPYNPLWSQLGDIYGAIGFPCKLARTIVIGKKADIVTRFLYVLSYFIRCSEVYENVEVKANTWNCELCLSLQRVNLNSETCRTNMTSPKDNMNESSDLEKTQNVSDNRITGTINMNEIDQELKERSVVESESNMDYACQILVTTVKDAAKECVRHLGKSPNHLKKDELVVTSAGITVITTDYDEQVNIVPDKHKQYCKYPSQEGNSMFDEYFENNISLIPGTLNNGDVNIEENNVKNCSICKENGITLPELIKQSPAHKEDDVFCSAQELLLPRSEIVESSECIDRVVPKSFGSSLIGSFSEHYLSDFVLHGTSEENIESKLRTDISMAVQNSVLDQSVAEAVCILADTDKWQVQLASSQFIERPGPFSVAVGVSQLVANMVESTNELWKLKMSPEFCLMHLEDCLQELYSKSKLLTAYLRGQRSVNTRQMTATIGCDQSDIPLLLSVTSTHSPHASLGFI